jgi:hypothetical protein
MILHDANGNDLLLSFETSTLIVRQSDGTRFSDLGGSNPVRNFYSFGIWYDVSVLIEGDDLTVYRATLNTAQEPLEYHFRLAAPLTMSALELRTADNTRSDQFSVDYCFAHAVS